MGYYVVASSGCFVLVIFVDRKPRLLAVIVQGVKGGGGLV